MISLEQASSTARAQPVDPSRTGYTFVGWFTAPLGGTAWSFASPVTDDTTLFARWAAIPQIVTFDSQGGRSISPAAVGYGEPVTAPANPVRAGHTFEGWLTAQSGGTAWSFTTPVTTNAVLHSQWSVVSADLELVELAKTGFAGLLPLTLAGLAALILGTGALIRTRTKNTATSR